MPEEKKNKKVKLGLIFAIVGVLAVIAVVAIVLLCKKEDAYRNIRITELEGEVVVYRGDKKELKAEENMNLQSGDELVTEAGAKVTLRLDDDKYLVVDEDTKLVLIAEGTAENSKTRIELEYGAVFSDIKNKLSTDSEYKVVAPSSVMSVRGTQFEVVYRELKDDAGKLINKVMKVLTFEGEVYVKPEGSSEKRVSKAGTMEVLMETEEGDYGFAAETKQIEAEDLSEFSASYLKEDLSKEDNDLSEEEKALRDALLEKVKKYFEGGVSAGEVYRSEDHMYSFVLLNGRTWEEINEYCEEHGGHLATIHSEEENNLLYDKMVEWDFDYAYFGITDEAVEDEWKWVTGDAVTYSNWYGDDIDNWNDEDYGMLWTRRPYYWNDGGLRESGDSVAFICEWEVNGTGTVIAPTPEPTPTPIVTPDSSEATGPLTLQVYLPKVMKPLGTVSVSDMYGLYDVMRHHEKNIMYANLEMPIAFQDQISVTLGDIVKWYIEGEGDILDAARELYGKDVFIRCEGFCSESSLDGFFETVDERTFAEHGVTSSYLTLYPIYTVYVPEDDVSHRYFPVRLMTEEEPDTENEVNHFYTFMVQEGTNIGLPSVEGYDMYWKEGLKLSDIPEYVMIQGQLNWPILSGLKKEGATNTNASADGTFQIQTTMLKLVKDPSAPNVSNMDALYSALEPYQMLEGSYFMEDVYVGDYAYLWFEHMSASFVKNRNEYLGKVEAIYGMPLIMTVDGYCNYSSKMFYEEGERRTFADLGIEEGDLVDWYPCFSLITVSGDEPATYAPCNFRVKADGETKYYGMMLPVNTSLELPTVNGYDFYWQVDGETVGEETIEVKENQINEITLCAE